MGTNGARFLATLEMTETAEKNSYIFWEKYITFQKMKALRYEKMIPRESLIQIFL